MEILQTPSRKIAPWWLALASGLLLWAAWPVSPLTLLIFVAWIPLLLAEEQVQSRRKFLAVTYLTMFTWNVATTWWIWNASAPGAVAAFLANSFLMCLPWLGYKTVKKHLGFPAGSLALILFWMSFEFIHLMDWGLSWPWLTLGNVFATRPEWIQWYEFTGTPGGTLWVLLLNLLLFHHWRQAGQAAGLRRYRFLFPAALLLALPVLGSQLLALRTDKQVPGARPSVVVVQPNIDPYEKVSNSAGAFQAQLERLIRVSRQQVDANTALLIWPETALYSYYGFEEDKLQETPDLSPLWSFLRDYPQLSLFTGIESIRQFERPTKYSQPYGTAHLESYNGAALLDSGGAHGFYHKSMLVPGVETLPWFLKFLGRWFDKFGGTTAGYARQEERTVLPEKNGFRIAPAICYESIYGEFMSRYIKNGANLICVITNDGWWKKTPGHRQHMNYARLRAIETRTWVARSANTGISCFISPRGEVLEPRPYNTEAAIKWELLPSTGAGKTLFVRWGDWLSRLMLGGAALMILATMTVKLRRRFYAKQKS